MPFTLAHPIAIAPLWYASRRRLDLSALIVGAMVPDIAYFVSLRPVSNIGHSPLGVLIQGIPAGLGLLVLFHRVMRRPLGLLLGSALPEPLAGRLPPPQPYRLWPFHRWGVIAVSLALGAFSHIFWDAFTHGHGWFVLRWPGLQAELWGRLPVYKLLQYGGGVVGLIALGLWAMVAWMQRPPAPSRAMLAGQPVSPRVQLASGLTLTIAIAVWVGLAVGLWPTPTVSQLIVQAVIGGVTGGFLGLLTCAIALRVCLQDWS